MSEQSIERLTNLLKTTLTSAQMELEASPYASYDRGQADLAESLLDWLEVVREQAKTVQPSKLRLTAYDGRTQDIIITGLVYPGTDVAIPRFMAENGVLIKIREEI
jgi:hypothetical protein